MTTTAQTWLMMNNAKLETKSLPQVTKAIEALDESKSGALMGAPMKSPIAGLLLTLFLGQLGVGRFYAGSIVRGIFCLLLWGLGILIISASVNDQGQTVGMFVVGTAGWMTLLDLFCIMGEIKRQNAKNLFAVLGGTIEPGLQKRMREHMIMYWAMLAAPAVMGAVFNFIFMG